MKTFAALAVVGLLAATHAHAAYLTASVALPLTTTDWDTAANDGNPLQGQTLQLPRFAGAGTLNSVTFNFSGTMVSAFSATDVQGNESLTNHLMGTLSFMLPSIGLTALDFDQTDTRNGSFDLVTLTASKNGTVSVAGPLAAFIGSGNFGIDVAALGTSEIVGSGNYDSGIDTTASAQLSVTYDWTPTRQQVPEPDALALVGLALAALALSRRAARA